MKKLLFACALLTSSLAYSQIHLGPKAGVNFATLNGWNSSGVEANTKVGFHVGGFVAFQLGKLMIQPELLYSTQGAKLEGSGSIADQDLTLNYFNVPIMVKYRTNGGFYLETGPQFGFKVGEDYGNNANDVAKNADFSWGAGLGYHSAGGFGVGARYNVGLSKLGEDNGGVFTDPDYKNSVIQISLFYSIFGNSRNRAKKAAN
jgi:hypothetical protein